MKQTNDKDYIKSNSIESVRLKSFNKKYSSQVLKCDDDAINRHKESQVLLDYLCDKFKIERVYLKVLDTNQRAIRNGHVCGDYNPSFNVIRVYNRTEKKGQVVAIKSFYETLLHEFIHHYDYQVLNLGRSLHTGGFYKRIGDLKSKL